MSGFRIGQRGTGPGAENIMGASLKWCGFRCDSIRIGLSIFDDEPIYDRFSFAIPGSYKFYANYADYEERMLVGGVELRIWAKNYANTLYTINGSEYFYVNGRQRDINGINLCGEVDVLLGRDSVRVTGDYSLLFRD
jgi:hypothetical protein